MTLPAAQTGVDKFVVYCSGPDGAVLQRYSAVADATASEAISAPAEGRSVDQRGFLSPLPAGDTVAFFNGRLLTASGRVLSYSDVYDFGLYNPAKNWIMLPDEIRIVAPCENGVFIGTTRAVYWYAGTDIAKAEVFERVPASSVRGAVFNHPNGVAVGWLSSEGVLIGTPDGAVASPHKKAGFLPPEAEYGRAWVREYQGETHVLFSLDTSARYPADVHDAFTEAREAYDDDQTTLCVNLTTGAASRYAWAFNSFAQIDRVLILAFQLAGEALRVALHLPVPGPVIGMALLLVYLILRPEGPSTELRNTAGGLLQNLSLLFVPAGTGVMLHVGRLADDAWPIAVALVASTVLGLLAAGLTLHWLARRSRGAGQ